MSVVDPPPPPRRHRLSFVWIFVTIGLVYLGWTAVYYLLSDGAYLYPFLDWGGNLPLAAAIGFGLVLVGVPVLLALVWTAVHYRERCRSGDGKVGPAPVAAANRRRIVIEEAARTVSETAKRSVV